MSSYSTQLNLIKMANQIGSFFETQTPNDERASAEALAAHVKLYWAPSMRARLVDQIGRGDTEGVHSIVVTAVRNHRETLVTAQRHVAAEQRLLGPEGGGDAG